MNQRDIFLILGIVAGGLLYTLVLKPQVDKFI